MTATSTRPTRTIRTLRHDPNERPFIVIWEVTRACALACTHCRADAIPARNPLELTTEEGYRLLDEIAAFGAPRPIVVLTGGDPFERPDLPELVRHGTEAGLHVALSPSVTPRLTEPVLRDLRAAGASAVSLSLDGATAAGHDGFRGIDGVFDQTLRAARTVRDVGYRLQINTTVTAGNAHELPDILRTVVELGASLWSVFFLVPVGRGSALTPLDPTDAEDVLH
ncbi:MAG: radical SAM protein, partial [Rhodococcus sp. (in: high G+C Gram-positive bacteria)]|uniref:radical SAM protein n=1 Tax=Rhodococcus sp. TaxID=1831 RepID=UPI003BB5D77A